MPFPFSPGKSIKWQKFELYGLLTGLAAVADGPELHPPPLRPCADSGLPSFSFGVHFAPNSLYVAPSSEGL